MEDVRKVIKLDLYNVNVILLDIVSRGLLLVESVGLLHMAIPLGRRTIDHPLAQSRLYRSMEGCNLNLFKQALRP